MTDSTVHSDQPSPRSAQVTRTRPKSWRSEPDAWRWNRRINDRYVNTALRLRSGAALPASLHARILAMGVPSDIVNETLHEVRHVSKWADAWIETAQRFLGDYRRQVSGSQRHDAAQARMLAALCYHTAQLLPGPDIRTLEHCRAAASTLAGQALPEIVPHARKIDIPWRNQALPSILIPGPDTPEPSGLVVVFNGTSTIKEEVLRWMSPLNQNGIATLLIDTPGTGESRHLGPPAADDADLLDGVFDMLRSNPTIDPRKVGVLGISLGGNLALRCLAYDRRMVGAAVVTPPYDPARWVDKAAPLVQAELSTLFQVQNKEDLADVAARFSLQGVAAHIQRPTLILGAGRDMVVPPSESTLLAAELGHASTLVWYPEASHAMYQEIPAWSTDVAHWFDAVQQRQSTRVDEMYALADQWREALYRLPVEEEPWDDSMGSARLLSQDELPEDESHTAYRPQRPDDEYSRAFENGFDARHHDASRQGQNQDAP